MENTTEATEASEAKSTKKVEPERQDRFGIKLDVGSIIVYIGSAGSGRTSNRRELCAGRIISFTPKMARVVPIISTRTHGKVTPKSGGEAYVTRPFDQISVASAEMQEMFSELNVDAVPSEWLQDIFSS